mmetsp:Transcript_113499/g.327778  ORF Transcript_113499/g.327778 Transcript_113499/m.327778 type:complete len:218 (-) Transcript_113499:186-839(-)
MLTLSKPKSSLCFNIHPLAPESPMPHHAHAVKCVKERINVKFSTMFAMMMTKSDRNRSCSNWNIPRNLITRSNRKSSAKRKPWKDGTKTSIQSAITSGASIKKTLTQVPPHDLPGIKLARACVVDIAGDACDQDVERPEDAGDPRDPDRKNSPLHIEEARERQDQHVIHHHRNAKKIPEALAVRIGAYGELRPQPRHGRRLGEIRAVLEGTSRLRPD